MNKNDLKYLRLLTRSFPNIQAASTEIVNLSAILSLPKGTEHFISDVHGEHEAFDHILRNASGAIRRRIREIFGNTLSKKTQRNLTTLIYYPKEKLEVVKDSLADKELSEWYQITLLRLVKVCRETSAKYTRSKMRKALPPEFAYVLEELLHERETTADKNDYYVSIIKTIVEIGRADAFLEAIAFVIQRLAIDHLHLVGDVYDRGAGAHLIMERLINYHSIDIQWGNHDILWMGAAAGSDACIANVLRVSLRYANMATLEHGYGINLLPLANLALDVYKDDPCTLFLPKGNHEKLHETEISLIAKMHKAIAVIQFKVEADIIQRNPHFKMHDRCLLEKIDQEKAIITIDGQAYPLQDSHFPTIDPQNPYQLTEWEADVVVKLRDTFVSSDKLQEHIQFFYTHGSLYLVFNNNLLYHGCIPMNEDGSFDTFSRDNESLTVQEYFDRADSLIRQAYYERTDLAAKQYALDVIWYTWCGPKSPLFGKNRMATFERYFLVDKEPQKEILNPYFEFRDDIDAVARILNEFGLSIETSHIINGHVPVKVIKGEDPVKAGGKLLVIDGGFARAYQKQTGIAGYTLVYNSYGLLLSAHRPFSSTEQAVQEEDDIDSTTTVLENNYTRIRIRDTDLGIKIQAQINDLLTLLDAYNQGLIPER